MKASHLATTATGLALMLAAAPALAASAGDWIVRGAVTQVRPDESTGGLSGDIAFSDLEVEVDDGTALGLTAAYFVTDTIAVELLASTPFSHDLSLDSGTVGGNDISGADIGEIKHLPPTLSVQYHFDAGALRPYVGAGINYTIFFDESTDADVEALGIDDLDLDDSIGLAWQVGADYELGNGWLLNADARYIDIDTEATLTAADGTSATVDVDIDPYVFSVGVGYRF